jgi:tape measure domain-containing protein
MAVSVGDLVIDIKVKNEDFRRAMGQTVALTNDVAAKLEGFAKRTEKLGATGFGGFRDPSGQVKGFIDTQRAMAVYEGEVNNLVGDLQVFSTRLAQLQAPLFSLKNQTALVTTAQKQASQATAEQSKSTANLRQNLPVLQTSLRGIVPLTSTLAIAARQAGAALGFQREEFTRISPQLALVAAGYEDMVGRSSRLSLQLRALNLVNFNVFASMQSWNTLDVLAGPGRLVEAFDRLRVAVLGGSAPMRQLQFAAGLALPGIQALGQYLIRIAQDNATEQFGANLLKLSNDLRLLGSGFIPQPLLVFANAVVSVVQRLNQLRAAISRGLTREIQFFGRQLGLIGSGNPFLALEETVSRVAAGFVRLSGSAIKLTAIGIAAGAYYGLNAALVQTYRASGLAAQGLGSVINAIGRIASSPITAVKNSLLSLGGALGLVNRNAVGLSGAPARAIQGFTFGFSNLGPGIAILAQSGPVMASTFALAAGSIKAFQSAANFEQTQLSFETLLGSVEKGRAVLDDLSQFSEITPFDPDPIIEAGRFLLTANEPADNLRDTLRQIGDVASGVKAPIEEIAQKFARVANENRLTGEILTQFGERGIPVAKELAKIYGVTEAQVRDLAKEGRIGIDALRASFANLTGSGGQFENLMQKQSRTTLGLLSTLRGRSVETLRGIGGALIEALGVREVISGFLDMSETSKTAIRDGVVNTIVGAANAIKGTFGPAFSFVRENLILIGDVGRSAFGFVGEVATSAFGGVVDGAKFLYDAAIGYLYGTSEEGQNAFTNLKEFGQDSLILLEYGFKNWKEVATLAVAEIAKAALDATNSFAQSDVGGYLESARKGIGYVGTAIGNLGVNVENAATTIGTNLAKPFAGFSEQSQERIAKFDFDGNLLGWQEELKGFEWTPLTEGWEQAVGTMGTTLAAEIDTAAQTLGAGVEAMREKVGGDAAAFLAERKKELEELRKAAENSIPKPDQLKKPVAPQAPGVPPLLPGNAEKGGDSRQTSLAAVEAGSSEAFRLIAESRRSDVTIGTETVDQIELQKQTNKLLGEVVTNGKLSLAKLAQSATKRGVKL